MSAPRGVMFEQACGLDVDTHGVDGAGKDCFG